MTAEIKYYLDKDGVTHLWQKTKDLIADLPKEWTYPSNDYAYEGARPTKDLSTAVFLIKDNFDEPDKIKVGDTIYFSYNKDDETNSYRGVVNSISQFMTIPIIVINSGNYVLLSSSSVTGSTAIYYKTDSGDSKKIDGAFVTLSGNDIVEGNKTFNNLTKYKNLISLQTKLPSDRDPTTSDWSGLRIYEPNTDPQFKDSDNRITVDYDWGGERGVWSTKVVLPKWITTTSPLTFDSSKGEGFATKNQWISYVDSTTSKPHFLGDSLYQRLQHTNEVNFTNTPEGNNRFWFNYRDGDTDTAADSNKLIKNYYFGDRSNTGDQWKNVSLIAGSFSGTYLNNMDISLGKARPYKTYGQLLNQTPWTTDDKNNKNYGKHCGLRPAASLAFDDSLYTTLIDTTGFSYPYDVNDAHPSKVPNQIQHVFGGLFGLEVISIPALIERKLLHLGTDYITDSKISVESYCYPDHRLSTGFMYSMPIAGGGSYLTVLKLTFDLILHDLGSTKALNDVPLFRITAPPDTAAGSYYYNPNFSTAEALRPWVYTKSGDTKTSQTYDASCYITFIKGSSNVTDIADLNVGSAMADSNNYRYGQNQCIYNAGTIYRYDSSISGVNAAGLLYAPLSWNLEAGKWVWLRVYGTIDVHIITKAPDNWKKIS